MCTTHAVLWISAVLALPELAAWLGGIAVLWTWTEGLLLAVVLDKEEGKWDGEEEEDTVGDVSFCLIKGIGSGCLPSDDGNRESGSLKTASSSERWQVGESIIILNSVSRSGITITIWCINHTTTSACTISVYPGNIAECASECKVEDDAEEAESSDAT